MHFQRRTLICFHAALISLVCATPLFAAEQEQYPWPRWHAMPWPAFWWIFPLRFVIMIIVMFIFMMRRGGMGCMWRDWMIDRPEIRDAMKRSSGTHSESALEILNKRYAMGEIDKQEYEEKKATITRSE
jgi:uncharacterized membrane protein